MKTYIQKGYLHYLFLIPIFIFTGLLIIGSNYIINSESVFYIIFSLIMVLVFIISFLNFYQIKLEIDKESITISLGIGWIKKKILISEIKTIQVFHTGWGSGVGIRYIGRGWLYNVKAGKTIELTFKSKSNIIQIGFDQADEITMAINNLICKYEI